MPKIQEFIATLPPKRSSVLRLSAGLVRPPPTAAVAAATVTAASPQASFGKTACGGRDLCRRYVPTGR
jgi:hypothetical protein